MVQFHLSGGRPLRDTFSSPRKMDDLRERFDARTSRGRCGPQCLNLPFSLRISSCGYIFSADIPKTTPNDEEKLVYKPSSRIFSLRIILDLSPSLKLSHLLAHVFNHACTLLTRQTCIHLFINSFTHSTSGAPCPVLH